MADLADSPAVHTYVGGGVLSEAHTLAACSCPLRREPEPSARQGCQYSTSLVPGHVEASDMGKVIVTVVAVRCHNPAAAPSLIPAEALPWMTAPSSHQLKLSEKVV